ncbi:hypothetical protein [Streptomyces sp. NPDC006739]|uniref:hypothetical protein n=1 Tax=Streptomyces sp. NPDC006739 TaxID=3364763 RepID=UPI0036740E40
MFCALVQRSGLARVDDAAAADTRETPADARTLQRDWDRVIVPRAVLQGLAVLSLGASLLH